jgi:hypothetical protein
LSEIGGLLCCSQCSKYNCQNLRIYAYVFRTVREKLLVVRLSAFGIFFVIAIVAVPLSASAEDADRSVEHLLGSVRVKLAPPVMVALSAPDEKGWGQHQFPTLSKLPDGRLWLTYNTSADRDDEYGHPGPAYVSDDAGQTWQKATPADPLLAISHSVISPVGEGEFLCAPMSPSLPIEKEQISLPEPAGKFNCYGEVLQYRLADLPTPVSDFVGNIPALRWNPARQEWVREIVAWDKEDALLRTRKDAFVFSRPYIDNGLVPVGKRLLYASYHLAHLLPDGSLPKSYTCWCMASDDRGRTWRRLGLIDYDTAGDSIRGEPTLVETAPGELACLIRTTDHRQRPLLITHSRDGGASWEPSRELFPFGVMPQLLRLDNGVVVASFGRPGVQLAFAQDAAARNWSEMLPMVAGESAKPADHSCGYTRMVALDQNSFLIAYSDFKVQNDEGQTCKAIVVRRVEVERIAPAGK